MLRFSHRFAAASIAVVLLLVPVTVQAAPDRAATAGWGAAVLAGIETALEGTWNAITAALGTATGETSDDPDGEALQPDGFAATTTSDPGDGDTEMRPGWDPNG